MAKLNVPTLFGSIPARFESDFSLHESVERLSAATRPLAFGSFFEECALGKVTASRVSLQRMIPMVGNALKPFFKGSFHLQDGRIVLDGRFTIPLVFKIWFGSFIALSLVPAVVGAVVWAQGTPNGSMMLVIGLGMAMFGMCLVWVGRSFARNDVDWLSAVIATALSKGPPPSPILLPSVTQATRMIVVQIALALCALATAISAATGIAVVQTGANGIELFPHTWWTRLGTGLGAILLAVMWWGVHQRSVAAWRIGLVGLPLGGLFGIAQMIWFGAAMWPPNQPGIRWFVIAFVSVGGALITAYWTFWWKKQRDYFESQLDGREL